MSEVAINDAPTTMLVCHYGLERSRAAAEALQKIGARINHFVGGTREISCLSTEEIKEHIKPNTNLLLIYDQGSPSDEYTHKEMATKKLDQAGIGYTIIDTAQLEIMLYEQGLNLSDYLY
jgi:hypothetical protein